MIIKTITHYFPMINDRSNKMKFLFIAFVAIIYSNFAFTQNLPSYVPTDSLAAWWPLDGNGVDLSGNSHNASINYPSQNYPVASSNRFGVSNSACFFDGVDDHLEVPHHIDFNNLPLTISFWIKADGYVNGAKIIDKYCCATWNGWNIQFGSINGIPNSWEYAYFTSPCNGLFQSYCNPIEFPVSNGFDNTWHNYVFVIDTTGGKVYRDAQLIFQQPWFINGGGDPTPIIYPVATELPVTIGADGAFDGGRFHGSLDDIGIWKRALNESEILQLYGSSDDFCINHIKVFNDYDNDCLLEGNYMGINNMLLSINSGQMVLMTNQFGEANVCDLNLQDGDYQVELITNNTSWDPSCSPTGSISIINGVQDSTLLFGLVDVSPCPVPDISIICPTIRRCSEHTWPIYVKACNLFGGTAVFENAYVLVHLDEGIIVDPATTPPFTMVGDLYRFEIGNINPGQCVTIIINANFSCDLELGETLCMEATLYPVPDCTQNNTPPPGPCQLPWDHSSLSVEGWCDELADSIYFIVTNSGEAMDCSSEVRVYLDNVLYDTYTIQLSAESDTTFAFPSTEGTWILQADQHPLHPGNSQPNDHVEGCGDEPGGDGDDDDGDGDTEDDDEWTPGMADNLPCGDQSPFVDVFCGEVVGSFDPNDKKGFPDGVGESHEIQPNLQMQYLIRFQNTGTAEAYNIIIRDTLDSDLDITSVVSGVSSHNHTFNIYGQRILQWTFNNIMLPDSGTNEEASHGFVTFIVNQQPDLVDGSVINNTAAIYFDFNDPIITNTTVHTINCCIFTTDGSANQQYSDSELNVRIFPNPSENIIHLSLYSVNQENTHIRITDLLGRVLLNEAKELISGNNTISYNISDYAPGVYLIHLGNGKEQQVFKVVKE